HAVQRINVRVTYPDGRVLGGGSGTAPEFRLLRPNAFFARLGRDTKVGFGEAYMAGDWRAGPGTDLADLLTRFAARLATLAPSPAYAAAPGCWRSAPDGAHSPSAQRDEEPASPRSPSPESSWNSPASGPSQLAYPTAWTCDCRTTARSKASTTPSSASR